MKWKHAVTVGACVTVLLGAGVFAAPAYSAETNGADVPDAWSALKGEFRTQDGSPVEIISDDASEGERIVLGRTKSGVVVRFLVQSTSITDADRAAMRRDVTKSTNADATASYSDTTRGVETFEVIADPLSPDLRWDPVSVIASTSSDAAIAWTAGDFTARVRELADERSHGGEVILEDLDPGKLYSAELESSSTAVVDGQHAAKSRTIQFQTLPERAEQDGATSFTYQNWTTAYTHKTFIPDSQVSAAYCGNWPTYSFGGDGRSYRLPSLDTPYETPDYRTEMFGNVNWDNPAPYDFVWTRAVGASKIYNNNVLQATLYASTTGMVVREISVGTSYGKAYFDHWSSNPHCKFLDVNYAGAIRYAEWVEFYRSGTVAVDGYRYKAPAHEMYGRFNKADGSDIWVTISRRQNDGFVCLLGNGACGLDFYKTSASY